jgi:hypothetical protein
VPIGHLPGVDEAKKCLAHLEAHGPSEFAFTFKAIFSSRRRLSAGHRLVLLPALPGGVEDVVTVRRQEGQQSKRDFSLRSK